MRLLRATMMLRGSNHIVPGPAEEAFSWSYRSGVSCSSTISRTVFGPASRVFYDTLLAYLERGQDVLLGLGLVLVVAGCFAGENK